MSSGKKIKPLNNYHYSLQITITQDMKYIIFFFMILLGSCSKIIYVSNYKVGMSKIEIDGKKSADSPKMVFRDSLIDIAWLPNEKTFAFELYNISDNSFQILWDNAAIVNENGESKRIFHTGVKYSEAEKSQPPTTVIKGSKVIDGLVPADGVKYIPATQYTVSRWETQNIYFSPSGKNRNEVEKNASLYLGRTIQVLLPIKRGEKVTEYVFHFILKEVDVKPERVPDTAGSLGLSIILGLVLVLGLTL